MEQKKKQKETGSSKQIDVLKKNFPQCFDKHGKFMPQKLSEIVETSDTEFSNESYSLNWLGKSYARLLANENPLTLLSEDKAHNQKPENKDSENLLIKGDNLEVLKHLKGAYSESIKMIYIDPPYNTGSDGFVYQDDRKFTVDELSKLAGIDKEEAKRVLEFTESKANSHSAWLTFMYPRLYVARELLKDDGVIFISIDDNELGQLKLLCDEVFGEANFISSVTVKMSHLSGVKMSHRKTNVPKIKEHLLLYSRNKNLVTLNDVMIKSTWKESLDRYKSIVIKDESAPDECSKWVVKTVRNYALSKNIDVSNDDEYTKFKIKNSKNIIRTATNSSEEFKNIAKRKVFTEVVSKTGISKYAFNGEEVLWAGKSVKNDEVYSYIGDIWSDIGINNLHNEGSVNFKNGKKPLKLIQRLIELATDDGDIVLDFFAGSGTTAHAVMLENTKGKLRTHISIQIPQLLRAKSKDDKDLVKLCKELDVEENIFEVTKSRIEKAIEEVGNCKNDFAIDLGVKIFKTVPLFNGHLETIEKLEGKQTKLFDGAALNKNQLEQLLTSWKVQDGIPLTTDMERIRLDKYTAYQHDKVLYLMDKGFSTDGLTGFFKKLDGTEGEDKSFEVEKLVLFGYNFESKHLKEIQDAVNQYKNRKQKVVSVVVRH